MSPMHALSSCSSHATTSILLELGLGLTAVGALDHNALLETGLWYAADTR